MKRIGLFVWLIALGLPAVARTQPAKALEVELLKDVTYRKVGDTELKLDLARPKGNRQRLPLIVCIHGGGWKAGRRHDLRFLAQWYAAKGFVSATISYRLAPKAHFPAQFHDCRAAVRWLRACADKYGIDPKRVGAVGFSAGAHLACMLGTVDEDDGIEERPRENAKQSGRVQAVVSFFGPTDFIEKTWGLPVERTYLIPFFGGTYEKLKQQYVKGSPVHYVTKDDPPFLFFHGDKDTLVPIHHSQVMVERLKKAGVPARLVTVKGAGHGWLDNRLIENLEESNRFFRKHLAE